MSLMMISDNVYCNDEDNVPRVNSDVHCVEPLANNKGCFFLFSIFSKKGNTRYLTSILLKRQKLESEQTF